MALNRAKIMQQMLKAISKKKKKKTKGRKK